MKEAPPLKRVKYKNKMDVDVAVRDAYGQEHILFPNAEKEIVMLIMEKSNDRKRSVCCNKG